MLKLDIGCGSNKRKGYLGIDIINADGVDFVLDITQQNLPLEDNTVKEVYSNHFFEHIDTPQKVLEELIRVSSHGATFEIWTPYLKSNEAFTLGHRHFYNETIWRHICIENPHFWLKNVEATLRLDKFCYIVDPKAADDLKQMNIPLSFGLAYMFNIALELGSFMTVLKGKNVKNKIQGEPGLYYSYSRQGLFERLNKVLLNRKLAHLMSILFRFERELV